jgi:hypothetical protein
MGMAFDPNLSMMRFDYGFGEEQTESKSLGFTPEPIVDAIKSFENLGFFI